MHTDRRLIGAEGGKLWVNKHWAPAIFHMEDRQRRIKMDKIVHFFSENGQETAPTVVRVPDNQKRVTTPKRRIEAPLNRSSLSISEPLRKKTIS